MGKIASPSPEISAEMKKNLRVLFDYLNEVEFSEKEVLEVLNQFDYKNAEETLEHLNFALWTLKENKILNCETAKKVVSNINHATEQAEELLQASLTPLRHRR